MGTTGLRWSNFLFSDFFDFFPSDFSSSSSWTLAAFVADEFVSRGCTLSVWYDMFPYSWRKGKEFNRNWQKFFRIPNHHLFPPLALKLNKIRVKSASSSGPETLIKFQRKSPSNLSASNTWKTRMGSTVKQLPMAELMADLRCCWDTSGVRSKIPQKIKLYKTPTKLKHNTIQSGTKTTSQLHCTNLSNFNGRNTNWRAFTAKNNSNWNKTKRERKMYQINLLISQLLWLPRMIDHVWPPKRMLPR